MLNSDNYLEVIFFAATKVARRFGRLDLLPDLKQSAYEWCKTSQHNYKPGLGASEKTFVYIMAETGALKGMEVCLKNSYLHRTGPVPNSFEEEDEAPDILDLQTDGNDPEKELLRKERINALNASMADVEERYGPAIASALIEGIHTKALDYKALGAEWGCSERHAQDQLRSALDLFFAGLRDRGHETAEETQLSLSHSKPRIPAETIERIRELRNQGWSQRAVAKELGIQQATVNRYAKGMRAPLKRSEKVGPLVLKLDRKSTNRIEGP